MRDEILRQADSGNEGRDIATALPTLAPIDSDVQRRLRVDLQRRQTADFYYLVDVVGTCNLRCPSCPVGNYADKPPKGLMQLGYFQSILQKARAEHSGKRLFWGEPALHPELSKLISAVKTQGFGCGISCNLNVFPDMRKSSKATLTILEYRYRDTGTRLISKPTAKGTSIA
jgi:hypothetical protein